MIASIEVACIKNVHELYLIAMDETKKFKSLKRHKTIKKTQQNSGPYLL